MREGKYRMEKDVYVQKIFNDHAFDKHDFFDIMDLR